MDRTRSFLKWAGSKYNCLSNILSSFPPGLRLIEPFTGSGVVFINTSYSSYLLAESNRDLIAIFTLLQKKGDEFINYCEPFFDSTLNCEEKYYQMRAEFNTLKRGKKKSALFLYLNRHGYNGLCRYNSQGVFNVPFGLNKKPYFPRAEMVHFHQKCQNAAFIQSDFRHTFSLAKPGDIIYCDPPYVPLGEHTKAHSYTQKQFSLEDQIELSELAQATASRGIPVLISNHDTLFTRQQYKNATIKYFNVPRWINCNAQLRQPVKELIAVFNPKFAC